MKIEAGKFYRTRDGRKEGPISWNPGSIGDSHPFVSNCGYARYTVDGLLLIGSETSRDIIAEWTDEPDKPKTWGDMTTGGRTLAELDVKPGDVAYYDDPDHGGRGEDIVIKDSDGWLDSKYDNLSVDRFWHIVSRANEPDKPTTWGEWEITAGPEYFTPRANMELAKSESGEVIAFRKRIEPARANVTLTAIIPGKPLIAFCNDGRTVNDTHAITFDTIDGNPVCDSIRMDPLGDD